MRRQGLVDSPGDIGPDGHACWGYDDPDDDFRDAAVAFLTEGLELGQALMFVGGLAAEAIIRSVEPLSSMVADGSLQVAPFQAVYPGGRRMSNADQWAAYQKHTQQALDDGATGLRVVAEVTSLASTNGGWPGQARWESYADRRMADFPLAALCCFNRSALAPEDLGAIASAHPVVDRRLEEHVPFRMFGQDHALAIVGEVDAFASQTLKHLLRVNDAHPASLTLDLAGLTFIDHTGVRALHEYAEEVRAQGRELTIRSAPPAVERIAELLGFSV